MFTQLYNKCLKLAAHKYSNYFLAVVSFLESSFFPIPPDVMIAPMAMANKNKFFKISLVATIFSVLGGMFGYVLGLYFFDFAMNIVEFYNYEEKMANIFSLWIFRDIIIRDSRTRSIVKSIWIDGFYPQYVESGFL